MDYEKAYTEALERAKNLHKDAIDMGENIRAKQCEIIFPELAESEDARIRKALIRYHQSTINIDGVKGEEILAWLEKQDSYYTFEIKNGHWYKCVCDYMLNGSDLMFKNGRLYYCRRDWRLESEIDERNVKDIGVHGYKSFFRPATNQEIKDWLEKQGETSPVLSNSLNIGKEKEGKISPKWTEEDERHKNTIIRAIHRAGNITPIDGELAEKWLKSLKQRLEEQ